MWPRSSPNPVAAAPVYPTATPVLPARPPAYIPPVPAAPAVPVVPAAPPTPPTCGTALPAMTFAPQPAPSSWWSQLCAPLAVNCIPDVRYQTSWIRVPTTNYRPVNILDPLTGCATSTVQPCTTYSWQVRRVPTSSCFRPANAAVATVNYWADPCAVPSYPAVTIPGAVVSNGCGGCSTPTAVPAPYYTPGPAVPSAPATILPSVPPSPTIPLQPSFPATSQPTLQPGFPAGPTPADRAPSLLTPSPSPALPPTTTNYPPLIPPPVPPPLAPASPAPAPATGPAAPAGEPAKKLELVPRTSVELAPVPDPDATSNPKSPTLLDTRDRTAWRGAPPTWGVAPTVWPDRSEEASLRSAASQEPLRPQLAERPDTDGWHSVRP
jgi:hypothetical protein